MTSLANLYCYSHALCKSPYCQLKQFQPSTNLNDVYLFKIGMAAGYFFQPLTFAFQPRMLPLEKTISHSSSPWQNFGSSNGWAKGFPWSIQARQHTLRNSSCAELGCSSAATWFPQLLALLGHSQTQGVQYSGQFEALSVTHMGHGSQAAEWGYWRIRLHDLPLHNGAGDLSPAMLLVFMFQDFQSFGNTGSTNRSAHKTVKYNHHLLIEYNTND